jgi:cyclophilin family peptidyl-prolyl cis-trans isomerase
MRAIILFIACIATLACAGQASAAETTHVVFETTKGDIVMEVHPEWAPVGARHFIELVELGFYDGAPWFRVIDNWVAQTGISWDEELNKQYGEANIDDDPVLQGNQRGYVAFGMTDQPRSRSTHIYINFADNSRLDPRGFAAFAQVVEGMDVADSLYRIPDDVFANSGIDQDKLGTDEGFAQFEQLFPDADYICRAYVVCCK